MSKLLQLASGLKAALLLASVALEILWFFLLAHWPEGSRIGRIPHGGHFDRSRRSGACLGQGAELFLEKPREPNDLEIIFTTLRELARQKPAARRGDAARGGARRCGQRRAE